VWEGLEKEKELVITSNGKPIAVLTAVNEDNFEQAFKILRRARAMAAVEAIHTSAVNARLDQLTPQEIAQEIGKARRSK
jgi:antitoxin (DNA-binding transcriptional repressor) of toxin-antitoxin stability system